jgi:hypothetical protein
VGGVAAQTISNNTINKQDPPAILEATGKTFADRLRDDAEQPW